MEENNNVSIIEDDLEVTESSSEDIIEDVLPDSSDGTDSTLPDDNNTGGSDSASTSEVGNFAESLIDEELGGVPVVLVNDVVDTYAIGTDNSVQLPDYYVNYFSGVLSNIGHTDYVAFATRTYESNYAYNEHYILVYDIDVSDGSYAQGSYPYIDIYRSSSNVYTITEGTDTLVSIPDFAYGSFGHLSDLREDSYNVSLSILFAVITAFLFNVCTGIFDCVRGFNTHKGGK